jgi:hypothetical protein
MRRFDIQLLLSQVRLAFARLGAIRCVAAALCLAAVASWSWVIPELRTGLAAQRTKKAVARVEADAPPDLPAVPQRSENEMRLERFYANLGQQRYVEQQVKTLFAIAAKNGLVLSQAEYKPGYDKQGRFHTYQITLPVKGQYAAVRAFCEQVLLAVPFASLDDIGFKRNAVASAALEARLRFTFYLSDAQPIPHVQNAGGDHE